MKHQHILAVTALTIALLSACGTTQPTLVQAPQNLTTGFQAAPSNGGRLGALAAGAWETTRFATGVDDLTSSTWTKVTGLNVTANALANTVDSFDTQLDKLTHTGTDTKYANTRLNINAGETIDVSVMVAGSGVAQVWLQNTNDWSSISSKSVTLTNTPQRVVFTNVVKPTGTNNNIQLVIGDIQSSETVYVGGARTRASDTGTTGGGTGGTLTPVTVPALSSWIKAPGVSVVDNGDTFQKITTTSDQYLNAQVDLTAGQTYRYTAKVKGTGSLQLYFQQRGGAWTQYAQQIFTLTSTAQTVSFDVVVPNNGYPSNIGIGDLATSETFYVKDVKVEKVGTTVYTGPQYGPNAKPVFKTMNAQAAALPTYWSLFGSNSGTLVTAPWDNTKKALKVSSSNPAEQPSICVQSIPESGFCEIRNSELRNRWGKIYLNNLVLEYGKTYTLESGFFFPSGSIMNPSNQRLELLQFRMSEVYIATTLRSDGLYLNSLKIMDSVPQNQYVKYAFQVVMPGNGIPGIIKVWINNVPVQGSVPLPFPFSYAPSNDPNIVNRPLPDKNLSVFLLAQGNSILAQDDQSFFSDDIVVTQSTTNPETRDAFQQPFDTYSIWNTPLGDQADYQPANMNTDPYKNFVESGEPIRAFGLGPEREYVYQATASDSVVSVYRDDKAYDGPLNRCRPTVPSQNPFFGDEVNLRINANDLIPQNNRNNVTSVYDQTTGKLKEYNGTCRNVVGGPVTASDAYSGADPGQPDMRIKGPGLYGGHGGTTMSGLGGTIRKGELSGSTPIRHALKMTVQGGHYLYETNPGWRWPATQADGYAYNQNDSQHYRGKNPKYKIGSLLAIPPSVDISTFQLSEPVYKIAWALQNYGVYVVDDSVCNCVNLAMQADGSSSGANSVESEIQTLLPGSVDTAGGVFASSGRFYTDMAKLFPLLQIVDNNTPSTIGGPGIRRQPWLPTLP
jgi:hypothetical protein